MTVHSSTKNVEKYLTKYGEKECIGIDKYCPEKPYEHCIIIPAYNETANFILRLLQSPPESAALLVILIINQPDNDLNIQKSQQLWDELIEHCETLNTSEQHHWLTTRKPIDILLIDRFNNKIPRQQGVGLARKIGGDIACQLFLNKKLLSSWAHHTDADVNIPNNYLSCTNAINPDNYSALIYPHQHSKPQGINTENTAILNATKLYEKAIDYYVQGLKKANSPYAYHTLGSCIAANHQHYVNCRGFPKKSGGEDFYLLNKLAKVGKILSLESPPLKIQSRTSERVPFGTGPAVQDIIKNNFTTKNYLYYHPQCFHELKTLIDAFKTLNSNTNTNLWLSKLSPALQEALLQLNIHTLFSHLTNQSCNQQQSLTQSHLWLDAFKTLKLIHKLEKKFPKQALEKSLKEFTL